MIRAYLAILAAAQAAGSPIVVTAADAPPPVPIELRRADGSLVGRAMVWQGPTGLEVRVQAAGLPAGHYGVHLHAVGRCEGPDFGSAGPHWNPTGRQHGSLNPRGHHLGDLPNLDVDEHGAGRLEFTIAGASATNGADGIFDADGTAVVIHAGADDYQTDPSGNSGARIACGVLRRGWPG
jgi:Cu-Zn family superoxide dismutase